MAKLSQQLKGGRVSRTQRVVQQQQVAKEDKQFTALKEKAIKVQQEKFSGISTTDDYEREYNDLSADIKPFFSTPSQVVQDQADQLVLTKSKVTDRVAYAQQKLIEAKEHKEERERKAQESYQRKRSRTKNSEKRARYRKTYDEKMDDIDDDYDEDRAKWNGYIKGLNQSLTQLNQGKNISYQSVLGYADDVAYYEESREEARNENRNSYYKKLDAGDLKETFTQIGFNEGDRPSYSKFNTAIKDYNKKVDRQQSLISWSNKVGFSNLPSYAQKELNPQAIEFQKNNPTEKLSFDQVGNVTGVQSGKFGQSLSIENYNQKISEQPTIAQQRSKLLQEFEAKQEFRKNPFGIPQTNNILIPVKPLPTSSKYTNNNLDLGGKFIPASDLPLGYGGQQTQGIQYNFNNEITPTTQVINYGTGQSQGLQIGFDQKTNQVTSTTSSGIFLTNDQLKAVEDQASPLMKTLTAPYTAFKYVRDRVHFGGEGDNFLERLQFKYGKLDEPTQAEKIVSQAYDLSVQKSEKSFREYLGEGKVEKFETDLQDKYQTKYQQEFDDQYYKKLLYEEITPEKATEEFRESDKAKAISQQYSDEYDVGYKKLEGDKPYLEKLGRGSLEGLEQIYYKVQQAELKIVSNPVNIAGAGAVVGTGVKALSVIPPVVSTGLNVILFPYGTYKALSPKSTPIERAGGIITAGLSGYGLTKSAIRYYNKPVIKTRVIKAPRMNLRSSETLGKNIKVLTDGGNHEVVVYGKQKVGQVVSAGRRTLVTTEGRILKASFWKQFGVSTPAKDLYITRGLPSDMIKPTYYSGGQIGHQGFGVKLHGMSNYQKALKVLTNYGYTNYQATATLRYVAPRVTSQYVQGNIVVNQGRAFGQFELTKQPEVISVSKSLGIKTRGGKAVSERIYLYRSELARTEEGLSRIGELSGNYKIFSSGNLRATFPKSTGMGESLVKSSDTQELIRNSGIRFKDLRAVQDYKIDTDVFFNSKGVKNINVKFGDPTVRRALLFDEVIDLRSQGSRGWIEPADITKTPFAKTFEYGEFAKTDPNVKAIKNVIKASQKAGSNPQAFSSATTRARMQLDSAYAGTGQYEYGTGGMTAPSIVNPINVNMNVNALKNPLIPSVKVNAIKNIIQAKDIIQVNSLNLGLVSATGLRSDQKFDLKEQLKLRQDLNYDLKLDLGLKQDQAVKQDQVLKEDEVLKSGTKQDLVFDTTPTFLDDPVIPVPRLPKLPTPKPPTNPNFAFGYPSGLGGKVRSKIKTRSVYDVAYLPDFTSRAIGLKPEKVTQAQAQKKLKKILTGLEIRRSVIIQ